MIWVLAFRFENKADGQKRKFLAACFKKTQEIKEAEKAGTVVSQQDRDSATKAVLGMPPYNTEEYSLWTQCRHPNYFGEWCCWFGFSVSAIPSVLEICQDNQLVCLAMLAVLFYTCRLFYDCLIHWTGAGPAEHFSALKRGNVYAQYQRTVRCFWPEWMPTLPYPLNDHF